LADDRLLQLRQAAMEKVSAAGKDNDRQLLGPRPVENVGQRDNVVLLAKGAKTFGIPTILTAVETEGFSGYIWPQLYDVFSGQDVVERTSMNSWDSKEFQEAVKATGKKNIILAGLWTEVCVTWPTLNMLHEGYNIFVVEDACGATSQAAQDAALGDEVGDRDPRETGRAGEIGPAHHPRGVEGLEHEGSVVPTGVLGQRLQRRPEGGTRGHAG